MRSLLLFLFLCVHVIGWGQPPVGELVNKYYKVSAITNKSTLSLAVEPELKKGDRVMVIQMKGATITPSNSKDGTGKVSEADYNGAGNYEITTVCDVKGTNVLLVYDLLKNYDPQNGKVQLVKVHVLESGTVDKPLQADPWNGETGGVLAISASGTLNLQANISADGKGFKGGAYTPNDGDCFIRSEDYYDPTPVRTFDFSTLKYINVQYGARKGESIVGNLSLQHQGGREAVANGGGGGNNHNNGGGGGSNLSLGGIGGGNASTATAACKGNYPGRGGYALSSNNGQRIFLGGGGGAGHGNNTMQKGGGNGGGILFIEATTLVNNGGYKISSNGDEGGSTVGDGASGGGAGGTIILSVGTYTGSFLIEAKGGKGGTENEIENQDGRCFGEGGGGSGGVLYVRSSVNPPGTISVEGGDRGEKLNSDCPNSNRADGGTRGAIVTNYSFARSIVLAVACPEAASMAVVLLYFNVNAKGVQASAEWKVDNPGDAAHYVLQRKAVTGDWKDIHTIPAEERTTLYRRGDGPLAAGTYLYRLRIVEKDRSVAYSDIQRVTVTGEDLSRLVIYPNPASSEIAIATPAQDDEWLSIYDMKSRLVYRKKVVPGNSVIRQDISFLAEGVYMVQVGRLTARFVVFK